MKRLLLIPLVLPLAGCALGAGAAVTAGYASRAGTADDLNSNARKAIIEDSVDKSFSKTKEYVDGYCVKKEQK